MKADGTRGILYSAGEDRRICLTNIKEGSRNVGVLKTSNSQVKYLALDSDMKRLYASTLEGLLLILNVNLTSTHPSCEPAITLLHTISFPPSLFASKLELDTNSNMIFCLLKSRFPKQT